MRWWVYSPTFTETRTTTYEVQKMNDNNVKTDIYVDDTKKRVAPKKPPRLSIIGKTGNYPKQEKDKRDTKDINSGLKVKKISEDKEDKENKPDTAGSSPHVESDCKTMNEKRKGETEHIYESISDHVATKNTSSQTEECSIEFLDYFIKTSDFKVFKETSCQTECTDMKRNKKRNSESEDMATSAKTKECRLSNASSTSTSRDSADSGHFSVQVLNPERSPTMPKYSENSDVQYLWQPEGLTNEEAISFMNSLPSDKVPQKGSPDGITYFQTQLAYQNPEQDADPTLCQSLTKDQAISLGNIWVKCLKACDTGKIRFSEGGDDVCKSCGILFHEKEPTVAAANGLHHPSCFQCTVCHEFLAKLIYHQSDKDDRLYCARHYAELFKSRCSGCEELILSGKVVQAMNGAWHAEHFCCAKCGEMITGKKYTKDQEKPLCLNCHATYYAAECKGCRKKIVIGQKRLSHDDTHWHDECFICEKCENTLVLGSFNIADEKVVCVECYQQKKIKLCYKCGDEIKAGSPLVAHSNQLYHNDCFCCKSCSQPISTGFMEHEGFFYCTKCHHKLFSQKCAQCDLPVIGDGVTYNDEVFHGSCFDCFYCHKPISSKKFLVRFGNRYCSGCYEKMFAKECNSCCELIKDEDYLMANELSWHNKCFTCTNCEKDLESIGFHMVDKKIYCPECPES